MHALNFRDMKKLAESPHNYLQMAYMGDMGGEAVNRIFVKVFGFSDVERHALNTMFRLSESRSTAYALWTAAAPQAAEMALIDGDSWEAALELANPAHDSLKLIWVGDRAPARASLVVARPLQWAAVIDGMDELFALDMSPAIQDDLPEFDLNVPLGPESSSVPGTGLNLDLEFEFTTSSAPLEPASGICRPHVLVVDASHDARLYMRARLAMAGLMHVDEAASGAEALQWLNNRPYKLVVLDLELPDMDSWRLVKQVGEARPAVDFLILTGSKASRFDAARGWLAGARACLCKPLHPGKLEHLLLSLT